MDMLQLVSGRARTVAKMIVVVRGTVATDVGVLVISMRLGLGKCTLLGKGKGGSIGWFP